VITLGGRFFAEGRPIGFTKDALTGLGLVAAGLTVLDAALQAEASFCRGVDIAAAPACFGTHVRGSTGGFLDPS